jgi:hypothetical protein
VRCRLPLWYRKERRRHKAAIGFYAVTRWLSSGCRSSFTTSRFMATQKAATPSSTRRSQAAGAWVAWSCCGLMQCRKVLSAAPVMCVSAFNITASYAKRKRRKNSRPSGSHKRPLCLAPWSGKYRHTSQGQLPSPSSRGSKTGLVMHHPFVFYCIVGCARLCIFYLLSLRGLFWGGFPLTPQTPSGQVKQTHGRTRPHCHPLPG